MRPPCRTASPFDLDGFSHLLGWILTLAGGESLHSNPLTPGASRVEGGGHRSAVVMATAGVASSLHLGAP